MLLKINFKRLKVQMFILFFFVNRISVHAKQRQIHKNFVDLRDKGPCVQFADTLHVTRKLILEVLAHSCVTLCPQFHSLSCFVQCDDNYSFFFRRCGMLRSFVVEILHSKNKQCVPLSVFVQLHQQRTASNYQFSFFFRRDGILRSFVFTKGH